MTQLTKAVDMILRFTTDSELHTILRRIEIAYIEGRWNGVSYYPILGSVSKAHENVRGVLRDRGVTTHSLKIIAKTHGEAR